MNLNAGWLLRVRAKVYKDLARFPSKDRERILQVVESLRLNPLAGDIEKMKGEENTWRRRVGSNRIFYELVVPDKAIYVFRIERRTSKTY